MNATPNHLTVGAPPGKVRPSALPETAKRSDFRVIGSAFRCSLEGPARAAYGAVGATFLRTPAPGGVQTGRPVPHPIDRPVTIRYAGALTLEPATARQRTGPRAGRRLGSARRHRGAIKMHDLPGAIALLQHERHATVPGVHGAVAGSAHAIQTRDHDHFVRNPRAPSARATRHLGACPGSKQCRSSCVSSGFLTRVWLPVPKNSASGA